MNDLSEIQRYNEILALIQRLHTAFGDMFPHAGLVKIGGSRKFLQKSFLRQLHKTIADVRSKLTKCNPSEFNAKVSKLWDEVDALLNRLQSNEASMADTEINSIAVTLYFISGIAWNYLVEKLQSAPSQDKRYLQIEPVSILAKITNQGSRFPNADLNGIMHSLIEQVPSLAAGEC